MGAEQTGRTAVITGGGRGFGKAFGAALAVNGVHAVLVDIDGPAAEAAAADIRAQGGAATGLGGDVTDEARMDEIMSQAAAINGGPAGLATAPPTRAVTMTNLPKRVTPGIP